MWRSKSGNQPPNQRPYITSWESRWDEFHRSRHSNSHRTLQMAAPVQIAAESGLASNLPNRRKVLTDKYGRHIVVKLPRSLSSFPPPTASSPSASPVTKPQNNASLDACNSSKRTGQPQSLVPATKTPLFPARPLILHAPSYKTDDSLLPKTSTTTPLFPARPLVLHAPSYKTDDSQLPKTSTTALFSFPDSTVSTGTHSVSPPSNIFSISVSTASHPSTPTPFEPPLTRESRNQTSINDFSLDGDKKCPSETQQVTKKGGEGKGPDAITPLLSTFQPPFHGSAEHQDKSQTPFPSSPGLAAEYQSQFDLNELRAALEFNPRPLSQSQAPSTPPSKVEKSPSRIFQSRSGIFYSPEASGAAFVESLRRSNLETAQNAATSNSNTPFPQPTNVPQTRDPLTSGVNLPPLSPDSSPTVSVAQKSPQPPHQSLSSPKTVGSVCPPFSGDTLLPTLVSNGSGQRESTASPTKNTATAQNLKTPMDESQVTAITSSPSLGSNTPSSNAAGVGSRSPSSDTSSAHLVTPPRPVLPKVSQQGGITSPTLRDESSYEVPLTSANISPKASFLMPEVTRPFQPLRHQRSASNISAASSTKAAPESSDRGQAPNDIGDKEVPTQPFFTAPFQTALKHGQDIVKSSEALVQDIINIIDDGSNSFPKKLANGAQVPSAFSKSQSRTIAVLGDSGEGKSSLINSLLHFPDMTENVYPHFSPCGSKERI